MSAPQKIGGYPIERELGRGGMGIVYLGKDTKLGRSVAIKVLPEAFAEDPERLARFEREAKMLAALHHPNIAGIYGLEEEDGQRFLSLQYVEGPTLAERLARGPLPIDEALDVARQIAAALEAAHEAGIIHRDLKPGNVKLTPQGDVKVLDFGLAKGAGSAESNPDLSQTPTKTFAPTGVGVILGTAAYMSPEQARGKVLDRRTDIWSFGCVLYEMLTGKQLFGGETATDTIAKILEREPDWGALPAQTPEIVRELLRRCLEKDPRKRLRDVGDARLELDEAIAARDPKTRAAAPVAAPATARRGPQPLVYVTAVALLAALAMAWLLATNRPPPGPAMRLTIAEPEGAHLNGDGADCAISPDGQTVVFVAQDSSGTTQLWSRPIGSLAGRAIPGTDNADQPFWSPDSRWVGFFADGKLKKARLEGSVQTVCDAPNPRGGAWSPTNTIVFAPAGSGPLFAVNADGGKTWEATQLDTTRHDSSHRSPWFLPDGKHFVYVALPGDAAGLKVVAGSVEGGPGRVLLSSITAPIYSDGYLIFGRENTLMAQAFDPGSLRVHGDPIALPDLPAISQYTGYRLATATTSGAIAYINGNQIKSRLVWFDRSGRVTGLVPVAPAQYIIPTLSPDDRTIAVTRQVGPDESDVWLIDVARGVGTRFTFGPRSSNNAIWSRDGSQIAFESDRDGTAGVYVKPVSGATPEKLIWKSSTLFKHPTDWTPDGKQIVVYELNPQTGFDIMLVPSDGSGPPQPYLQTPFQETTPFLSPDGHWMLYSSNESGRNEIYVQSFPTPGHKVQVTTGGAFVALWNRSGKEIFVLAADGQGLSSVPIVESAASFEAGAPRPLFRFPQGTFGFAVTHDGTRFVGPVPQGGGGTRTITVVLNWKSALAAQVAGRP